MLPASTVAHTFICKIKLTNASVRGMAASFYLHFLPTVTLAQNVHNDTLFPSSPELSRYSVH